MISRRMQALLMAWLCAASKTLDDEPLLHTFFAASCLIAVGQVPDYVPTDGLVGWWPFEELSNEFLGTDPLSVSEVVFSQDRFVGQSAFFNDAGFIEWGDMPSPEEFITAWVRPSSGALTSYGMCGSTCALQLSDVVVVV